MKNKSIYVTQPSLGSLDEYKTLVSQIWESGVFTHNGPKVIEFEKSFCANIGVKNFSSILNGTLALQIAIKALKLKGEIITTPFTWIATLSAIQWEGCTPIFCDVEEDTFNIDPKKIEECITKNTVAIMPVHVFGTPCDVIEINRIAKKYDLKVIYDAAHAVGSTLDGESILNFGDISAVSLHATKILNTGEGGGCITNNDQLTERIKQIRFFGHNDNKDIVLQGTNAKMTEFSAALGLVNLKVHDSVLNDRRQKYSIYHSILKSIDEIQFQKIKIGESNYSYFPIVLKTENDVLNIIELLNDFKIFPRRYFYPSVNTFDKVISYSNCSISESLSKRILCLPLYQSLEINEIHAICDLILKYYNEKKSPNIN